jgi:hypothetical protein
VSCDVQLLTGFGHALVCRRVALPSSAVIAERRLGGTDYGRTGLAGAEDGVGDLQARLTRPLRTMMAEWLAKGEVKVGE